jgi:hypothetical protein
MSKPEDWLEAETLLVPAAARPAQAHQALAGGLRGLLEHFAFFGLHTDRDVTYFDLALW